MIVMKDKLEGTCNENTFWTEVAHIGWGTKTTDYNAVKKVLFERWAPEFASSFTVILRGKANELKAKIEQWEKGQERRCEVGDDSFDDLTAHITGLGKHVYAAVMGDPTLAAARASEGDYAESFSYCIPSGGDLNAELTPQDLDHASEDRLEDVLQRKRLGDWYDISPEKYKRWAQRNLDCYRAALAHSMNGFIHSDLTVCIPALKTLAEDGDIKAFLTLKDDALGAVERIEQWKMNVSENMTEFQGLLPYWGMKNMCGDVERWMG